MGKIDISKDALRENPFTVPEGYFDRLKSDILGSLPERQEPFKAMPGGLLRNMFRPLIGIAASVCIAVVGIWAYMGNGSADAFPGSSGGESTIEEMFASEGDASDYIMIDNDDIYRYLCETYPE